MRTVILFIGVAIVLYLTQGFMETKEYFAFQNFNAIKVFEVIPAWLWGFAIALDIIKK